MASDISADAINLSMLAALDIGNWRLVLVDHMKRDANVFEGNNGLILTGILTGIGTLLALLVATLAIIYIRKRYRRRRKTKMSVQTNTKMKERLSTEGGHPVLRSHFSHTPPIQPVTSSGLHPSLHITDLHLQRQGSTFQSAMATPPFQRSLTTVQAQYPATLPKMQRYNSCIPITSMTPRARQGSQLSDASGRPPSFLPFPRGLTPLSIPFSNGKTSSSPSGSISGRPGCPTVPSSDLLHQSMMGRSSSHEGVEDIASPFHDDSAIFTGPGDPPPASFTSSSRFVPSTQPSVTAAHAQKPNFSYPTPLLKHAHSRSTEYVKSGSMHGELHHLRNRSNGTVITYASSAYTHLTNATPKIQPVVFNDSPNSSISVDLYKPSSPYMANYDHANPPPVPSASAQISPLSNALSQERDPVPSTATLSREFRFPKPAPIQTEQLRNASGTLKRAKRRGSGSLPDMLFSRTPSHELPISPVTPISPGQDDVAEAENESVLDPLEMLAKEHENTRHGSVQLSSTTMLARTDRMTLERFSLPGRPRLIATDSSVESLGSSTSTHYGTAV